MLFVIKLNFLNGFIFCNFIRFIDFVDFKVWVFCIIRFFVKSN